MQIATSLAPAPGMSFRDISTYLSAARRPRRYAEGLARSHGVDLHCRHDGEIAPIDVCWRLFLEHATVLDDEMHCVSQSSLRRGGTTLLVARMLHCATVLEAVHTYRDAVAVIAPGLKVDIASRKDEVALRWSFQDVHQDYHCIAMESIAASYYAILSWLIDEPLQVLRVRAPAERKSSASTLLHVLNAPVAYMGQDLELIIARDVANKRVARRDIREWHDGVYNILRSSVLYRNPAASGGQFAAQVRAALLDGKSQKQIAFDWGMSAKTITRRLTQEGSSFRDLRDEIRMEKSASLILSNLSVEEVGGMVGYEDSRSFRRAFARWYGVSPSAYRDQRSVGQSPKMSLPALGS